MAYCTVDDILRLLPEYEVLQLADDQDAGTTLDTAVQAVLAEVTDQADREIDAAVGMVAAVPLAPVPALVTAISAKLAIHNLYLRRPGVAEPDPWIAETKWCRTKLDQIMSGRISLGPATGDTAPASTPKPSFTAGDRLMTRSAL